MRWWNTVCFSKTYNLAVMNADEVPDWRLYVGASVSKVRIRGILQWSSPRIWSTRKVSFEVLVLTPNLVHPKRLALKSQPGGGEIPSGPEVDRGLLP